MKKIYWIALGVFVLMFACAPSHAACYQNYGGVYVNCPCPVNGVTTSYTSFYSPYGSFTVSNELYLPTVTFTTTNYGRPVRRIVVRKPLMPPPPKHYKEHGPHGPKPNFHKPPHKGSDVRPNMGPPVNGKGPHRR